MSFVHHESAMRRRVAYFAAAFLMVATGCHDASASLAAASCATCGAASGSRLVTVRLPGSDPDTETFAPALGITVSQMKRTSDGVYYRDVTGGTGVIVTSANVNVTITFIGYLKDGSVFDKTTASALLLAATIPGFQGGMIGMSEGGERLMVIPSALAYGATEVNGSYETIPPNSTLVFDVQLRSIM